MEKKTENPEFNFADGYDWFGDQAKFVPIEDGTKVPSLKYAKRPDDDFHTDRWIEMCQDAEALAIICGERSGDVVCLDFDETDDALDFHLCNDHLPPTLRIKGARGWKIWYRMIGDYPTGSEQHEHVEWRANGNLAMVKGTTSAGGRYYIDVDAAPAAIEFKDIVWPKGWEVPGEAAAQRAAMEPLVDKFGPDAFTNKDGEPTKLNFRFWAGLLAAERQIKYCTVEEQMYIYEPKSGIWRYLSIAEAQEMIARRLMINGRDTNTGWYLSQADPNKTRHIVTALQGITAQRLPFGVTEGRGRSYLHVQNGVLRRFKNQEVISWQLEPNSPQNLSRQVSPITYDAAALCPRFEEMVSHIMASSEIITLQKFCGMYLWGHNIAQKLLLIDGKGGSGKGTLVKIIQSIIGRENTATIRPEMLAERFELARYHGKSMLIGADVQPDFLTSKAAPMIKALTGGDIQTAELKGRHQAMEVHGNKNILAVSNSRLRLRIESDVEAWKRRLVIISCQDYTPPRVIHNLEEVLVREEGSGILNWMIEGYDALMRDLEGDTGRMKIPADLEQKINLRLMESDSVQEFVNKRIRWDPEGDLSTRELMLAYSEFCDDESIEAVPVGVLSSQLKQNMYRLHASIPSNKIERDGKVCRGYENVAFKTEA